MTDTAKSALLSRPIIHSRDLPLDAREALQLQLERSLRVYDEPLLRQVAAKLIKPRNQWPADELIERCCATFDNITSIDRRLRELRPEERRLLALMGHSGQPRWRVVHLVEMAAALGDKDGIHSVRNLLEAGMLFPDLPENWKRLRGINQWFTQAGPLGLLSCPEVSDAIGPIQEADGLEWPLRLAALWQLASAEPLRKTQQGEFFKRDQERLRNDPLLSAPPSDSLYETTGIEFFTADLAAALGILRE